MVYLQDRQEHVPVLTSYGDHLEEVDNSNYLGKMIIAGSGNGDKVRVITTLANL